ncbi:MAG: DNA primase [Desulfovibrionaceae bacterium]|nr:DNA primase [Desulfovibrionaceae bacterium]
MVLLDLLYRRGLEPRKIAGSKGGEYACPCPACGGKDRFKCWPEQGERGTWWCRSCNKGGDAIEFLRVFSGLSYAEACAQLGVAARERSRRPLILPRAKRPEAFIPKEHADPARVWRSKAEALLTFAQEQLLGNPGELARLEARGLPRETVARFRLGWLPGEGKNNCYHRGRVAWGLPEEKDDKGQPKKLWIPRGLLVPFLGESGEALRLRVRRPDADRERFLRDMKFYVLPGSFMGTLRLSPAAPAGETRAWVVVEGELDAMACVWAAERAGLPVGALAVGTNRGKPDAAAHAVLSESAAVLVALDYDTPDKDGRRPGAEGFPWWRKTYRQAVRWPVPQGKDPGEAASLGVDLAVWIKAGLPPVLTLPAPRAVHSRQSMPVGRWLSGLPNVSGHEARLAAALTSLGLYAPLSPQEAWDMLGRWGGALEPFQGGFILQGTDLLSEDERVAMELWSAEYQDLLVLALMERARVSPRSDNSAGRPDAESSDQEHSQPSYCMAAVEA